MITAMAKLKPRERRVIVAGLAVVLLALSSRAVPAGTRAAAGLRARADAARQELARSRELVNLESVLRDSLVAHGARLVALAPRLVAGQTASEASAELGAIVTAAAVRHHVRITQQEARHDSTAGLFQRIAVRVEAEGDVRGLAGWLAELEEGAQLLSIPELSIHASEPAASVEQTERLRAELTITGWSAPRRSP